MDSLCDSGRLRPVTCAAQTALNKAAAEAMLISASILRLGGSKAVVHGIDDDARDRIVTSLKVGSGGRAVNGNYKAFWRA